TKAYQECNYLQGLEGECDSSHLNFLHRYLAAAPGMVGSGELAALSAAAVPRYETEDTDFGVRLIALRALGEEKTYLRVSAFMLPVACAVPVGSPNGGGTEEGYEIHFYT